MTKQNEILSSSSPVFDLLEALSDRFPQIRGCYARYTGGVDFPTIVAAVRKAPQRLDAKEGGECSDCPPPDYPTDATRCAPCPRRQPILPDRNCAFCGPGWTGAHKYRCPRAHEDYDGGGPVND